MNKAELRNEAKKLAGIHAEMDEGLEEVYIVETKEDSENHITLLEVNTQTLAGGILPMDFAANNQVRVASTIIEVTPDEFREIREKTLELPEGLTLCEKLYPLNSETG